MPTTDDILWFKQQFYTPVEAAVKNTPFSLDMLTAVACQETGEIWPILRHSQLSLPALLELCVGDVLDADKGRTAFPKSRAELVAVPEGEEMFKIARQALLNMAQYIHSYRSAAANPNKFCHAFGIFQYDLQFFRKEPDYFLQKHYANFNASLQKCVGELQNAMRQMKWQGKTTLTDLEMAYVAIAYNTGSFKPSKGLRQGNYDGRKYYGENFYNFLRLSKTVALPNASPELPPPARGNAILALPTPIEAAGPFYRVDGREATLPLQADSQFAKGKTQINVIAKLPDGQLVRALSNKIKKDLLPVETSVHGAYYRGYAPAQLLKPAPDVKATPVPTPDSNLPAQGIVAVYMPRKPGTVTRRNGPPGPQSLNEANQPGRRGVSDDDLRDELARIVNWLAVDKATHRRYQPQGKLTFCNIYAHDYCYLAGVYLPRVWWTSGAIEKLANGEVVEPLYGNTVEEQRANDLFRWLRDFGLRFGWRQTGSLRKLQTKVNGGAVGIIVAHCKQDGPSGHIVAVVPETEQHLASRNASGDVVSPVQSQAGRQNFRYGTSKREWWKDETFADAAFWLHA